MGGAYYHDKGNQRILGNEQCRVVWNQGEQGAWTPVYEISSDGEWRPLAVGGFPARGLLAGAALEGDTPAALTGGSYQVVEQRHEDVFADNDFDHGFRTTRMWVDGPLSLTYPADARSSDPPAAAEARVLDSSADMTSLQWAFTIADEWRVEATFTVAADKHHVTETVHFTRLKSGSPVRVRCAWHVLDIPAELISSSVKAVTHVGWRYPHGTFMVLGTHDRDRPWTPHAGGGGMINLTLGDRTQDPQQFIDGKSQTSSAQAFLHQAPPCMDTQGWLDLRAGESYELTHYLLMHPLYPFKPEFMDYMWSLQPQEYLAPRYPWRHFIDKCSWTLRHTPEGYEDGGSWGLYWKDWYNLTNDPKSRNGESYVERVHSLEWGASWDIWTAYFLLLYAERYDDEWSRDRYQKLRNGIIELEWQIDDPDSPVDGAFWMERDESGDFHISNWMATRYSPKTLWVCDAGKVGYFLCLLYQKTGDNALLAKAKKAAQFLLRFQNSNGDLKSSVFMLDGGAVWPSNLGGVTSAILLWAKLYEISHERRYIEAANLAADISHRQWLSNDAWQMHGGEIDSFGCPDSTTAMYAAMGYAALAMVTGEEKHKTMTRDAANYLLCQQWLFDINYGYYRKEGRWNGMECKTVGSLQGWIRPECTMSMYMAYKATGDDIYRFSMEQHASWMTYMQYDNPDSPQTFGGGHEVFEVPADQLNGFGSNFWPETVGQAIAMMELLSDDVAEATRE